MLYASLMESLIDKAGARLLVSERPAGVKLLLGEAHAGQVEASRTKTAFGPAHEVFTIFVDDTYVLGEDATDLCYATSALSQELAKAEQHLHPEQCQALMPHRTRVMMSGFASAPSPTHCGELHTDRLELPCRLQSYEVSHLVACSGIADIHGRAQADSAGPQSILCLGGLAFDQAADVFSLCPLAVTLQPSASSGGCFLAVWARERQNDQSAPPQTQCLATPHGGDDCEGLPQTYRES